jgi:hypothetical protein
MSVTLVDDLHGKTISIAYSTSSGVVLKLTDGSVSKIPVARTTTNITRHALYGRSEKARIIPPVLIKKMERALSFPFFLFALYQ